MSGHRGAISPAVRSGVGVFSLSHPASGFHPIASELIPHARTFRADFVAEVADCDGEAPASAFREAPS
jgi:hypothetical protein